MKIVCNGKSTDDTAAALERSKKTFMDVYTRSGISSKQNGVDVHLKGQLPIGIFQYVRAKVDKTSSGQLCQNLDLPTEKKTIQQMLRKTPTLQYKRFNRAPTLSAGHRKLPLDWSTALLAVQTLSGRNSFSLREKFNLDGPDS